MHPLPAYEALRRIVRSASEALADVALANTRGEPESLALHQNAELGRGLELRDATGALVPTDFIELTEWPGGSPEVAATIRFREAHAAIPARVVRPPSRSSDADSPAA